MATYNEEAKYKTWKVITTDCRGRVEYTYKLMTPSQALEYFRNAVEELFAERSRINSRGVTYQ